MLFGKKPVQIAYCVPDIRIAAVRHSQIFGSGPFFAADNIAFSKCLHRGRESCWDHSAAFGQWGDIMVEFMQQNVPGPSVITDIVGTGRASSVHHMGYFVDDPLAMVAGFERRGHPLALHCALTNGMEIYMVDTSEIYGHMIEFYVPSREIEEFFDLVRSESGNFSGGEIVRTVAF